MPDTLLETPEFGSVEFGGGEFGGMGGGSVALTNMFTIIEERRILKPLPLDRHELAIPLEFGRRTLRPVDLERRELQG